MSYPVFSTRTQYVVLGETKCGKSTFAKALSRVLAGRDPECPVLTYEAGSWVRESFARTLQAKSFSDELDPAFKNALTEHALAALRANPLVSYEAYVSWCQIPVDPVRVVVGVRNPDDFIRITQDAEHNVVLRLAPDPARIHAGALGQLEQGLRLIDDYLAWKATLNFPQLQVAAVPRDVIFASDDRIHEFLKDL